MRARREIDGRARALSLSDEDAARIIKAKGRIVVTPKGAVERRTFTIQASIGWAIVSVPMHDGGERAAYTTVRQGKHYIRSGRASEAKEWQFWTGPSTDDGYMRAFVEACGIPTLDDFEATLITPKGDPLADQTEVAARKRAVLHGYGHDMQPGWFLDLYRKQGGLCALSGLPMLRRNGSLCECLPVPDRIDSSRGYYPDNVRLVRHGLNMMRRDRDDATFARLCASMFLLRAA